MDCGKYLELLSARLDGELTEEETERLEAHLSNCPDCRAVGAQLSALQCGFPEVEEVQAPEGFAQGVMDRIRAERRVIPLFKRPQVRALAGLAACLALAMGLYGASLPQKENTMEPAVRGFNRSVAAGSADSSAQEPLCGDGDGPQVNISLAGPEDGEAPQIAAYAAPGAQGLEKTAPDSPLDTERTLVPPEADVTLILNRLPDGAAELIPSGVTVSHDVESGADVYTWLTAEELAAIEALAFEQGLLPGTTEGAPAPERCALIVQNR